VEPFLNMPRGGVFSMRGSYTMVSKVPSGVVIFS